MTDVPVDGEHVEKEKGRQRLTSCNLLGNFVGVNVIFVIL